MRFNLLYNFLTKQVYKPTVQAKCRVYMAKNLRVYQKQYFQLMHQMTGAQWNPILQNIAYDDMLIKKVSKLIICTSVLLVFIYLLI